MFGGIVVVRCIRQRVSAVVGLLPRVSVAGVARRPVCCTAILAARSGCAQSHVRGHAGRLLTPQPALRRFTTAPSASVAPEWANGVEVPSVTAQDVIRSKQLVLAKVQSADFQPQLDSVRESDAEVFFKWQRLLALVSPIVQEAVSTLGFPRSPLGVQLFNVQSAPHQHDPSVVQAHRALWAYLLRRVFEVDASLSLTEQEALDCCTELSDELVRPDVTEGAILLAEDDGFGEGGVLADAEADVRRERITEYIVSVQRSVLERHGWHGDEGWLQFQCALLEHASRPHVTQPLRSAVAHLYRITGLVPKSGPGEQEATSADAHLDSTSASQAASAGKMKIGACQIGGHAPANVRLFVLAVHSRTGAVGPAGLPPVFRQRFVVSNNVAMAKKTISFDNFREYVRKSFNTVDDDGSGRIDVQEFCALMEGLSQQLGFSMPDGVSVQEGFDLLDSDGDGELSMAEFSELARLILARVGVEVQPPQS